MPECWLKKEKETLKKELSKFIEDGLIKIANKTKEEAKELIKTSKILKDFEISTDEISHSSQEELVLKIINVSSSHD